VRKKVKKRNDGGRQVSKHQQCSMSSLGGGWHQGSARAGSRRLELLEMIFSVCWRGTLKESRKVRPASEGHAERRGKSARKREPTEDIA